MACLHNCSGTIDYQLYWFDGRSNLTTIIEGYESVKPFLDMVEPCASSTIVLATTTIRSGFITGVPAPTRSPTSTGATPSATTVPQITIRISNDQTGANTEATVFADGVPRTIPDLFRGAAIDSKDGIISISTQLVKFSDSTKCSLLHLNVRDWVIEPDGRARNFADLDGDHSKPIPVWLGRFTFQCPQV